MYLSMLCLFLSLNLILTAQLTVSVLITPSPQVSTPNSPIRRSSGGTRQETERINWIDKLLLVDSIGMIPELTKLVAEYEGLYTRFLASEVFKSPMTLESEPNRNGYTSTTNIPQHSIIELGTLSELMNNVQDNTSLRLELKISLYNSHCGLSDSEKSILGIEIRNEKTMETDRCMNVVLYETWNGEMMIQVSLWPSIATLDWKYYLVLPPLSNCLPDTQFSVSITYWYKDQVDRNTLPKSIYFGGPLPQQFDNPEQIQQVPTLQRIPYQKEDLELFANAQLNVPGLATRNTQRTCFEGIFATQTYTRGSMIHLGSMSEITRDKRNRNTIDLNVHVQVFDLRKKKEDVKVQALTDVRVLAYVDSTEEEKGTRLPNEDWAIKSFNGLALKDLTVDQEEETTGLSMLSLRPMYQPSGGVVLTKSLARNALNTNYWLRLPPLPHGFEYRVTNSMVYMSYLYIGIKTTYWIGKDYGEEEEEERL